MDAVIPPVDAPYDARVADRTIHGEGTPERAWRTWDALESLTHVSIAHLTPHDARVVVVAPHPDDEVLGCGGTLALLARAGHEVIVIGVTDGEASHPGSTAWTPSLLAHARRDERLRGLARLGVSGPAYALGLPDGGVADHEATLAARLRELLRPGDSVFATWRLDGHPDHEAAGRAAVAAARDRGCRLYEFPVWMWHWAAPGDSRVPWAQMQRLALDADARQRKSHAIAAHVSQLVESSGEQDAPVLPDWALARLLRPFEVFIAAEPSA